MVDNQQQDEELAIMEEFIHECNEHLENIETNLISLEKDIENKEVINALFRAFHTIKGNSRWMNMEDIASVSHATENLLGALRDNKFKYNPEIGNVIFSSLDILRIMVKNITAKEKVKVDTTGIIKELETIKDINLNTVSESRLATSRLGDSDKKGEPYLFTKYDIISLIKRIVTLIECNNTAFAGKSNRICNYAIKIAKEVMPEKDIDDIILASLLHDIGMIGIPQEIVNKPGKLTDDEYVIIKGHSICSAEIFKDIRPMETIAKIVRHHHERIDGKGYPDGLKGEDIPLGSRILAIADTFDALMSDRPHRSKLSLLMCTAEINNCANSQFDPKLVEIFNRLIRAGIFTS